MLAHRFAPKDPIGAKTTNHDAIMMMLDMVSDDQWVLMPTTNSAYGTGDDNNFCDENSPLRPISSYAIEKVAIEKELMKRENSISFAWRRCLACHRACASTFWSMTSCIVLCATRLWFCSRATSSAITFMCAMCPVCFCTGSPILTV